MNVILGVVIDGNASRELLQLSPLTFVGSLHVTFNGRGFKGASGARHGEGNPFWACSDPRRPGTQSSANLGVSVLCDPTSAQTVSQTEKWK